MFGLISEIWHKWLKALDPILPKSYQVADHSTTKEEEEESKTTTNTKEGFEQELFPSKIHYDDDPLTKSTAIPCSTSGASKLVKVEDGNGVITWKFESQDAGISNSASTSGTNPTFSNITSPFLTSSGSTASGGFSPINNFHFLGHTKDSPSPLSMEQSNNNNNVEHRILGSNQSCSDMDSTHSLEEELSQIPDLPNPEFFDIKMKQQLNNSSENENEHEQDDDAEDDHDHDDSDKQSGDNSTPGAQGSKKKHKSYTCDFCGAEFRMRGYLTRHIKKHALNKAYECPFFEEDAENKCHPNGGFSRRDTYKTHLKARHFRYPPGTKSQDRAVTGGKCGMCNKSYESNEEWVEKHIEGGECEGLPRGYQIRVKNSRRKNYEYPLSQPQNYNGLVQHLPGTNQISPISSNSNDSPMTSNGSPNIIQNQINSKESVLSKAPMNLQHSTLLSTNKVYAGGVQLVNDEGYNDYDNNDEFSLDVEQASFHPMMQRDFY